VPSLEPPGAWLSSSPWLPPVPRSSAAVARPHVREEHVGGADLRPRPGLGEGGRKARGGWGASPTDASVREPLAEHLGVEGEYNVTARPVCDDQLGDLR
jgi:hypothetical protein